MLIVCARDAGMSASSIVTPTPLLNGESLRMSESLSTLSESVEVKDVLDDVRARGAAPVWQLLLPQSLKQVDDILDCDSCLGGAHEDGAGFPIGCATIERGDRSALGSGGRGGRGSSGGGCNGAQGDGCAGKTE